MVAEAGPSNIASNEKNLRPTCYVFRYRILKPASNEMIHKSDTNDEDNEADEYGEDDENDKDVENDDNDENDEDYENDEDDEKGQGWLLSRITL